MSELKECKDYWVGHVKDAKERFEMVSSALAFVIGALILALEWFGVKISGLQAFLNSSTADWTQAIAFSYVLLTLFIWLPFKRARRDRIEREQEINRRDSEIASLKERIRPNKFQVECGDHVPNSVTRDWDVTLSDGINSFPTKVTFLGFTISNPAIDPIDRCRALLTKVEKAGVPIWTKQIALSFEPRSPTENEPIEEVTVENGTPRSVALCSIANSAIMPGSLNQTSRYRGMFEGIFKEPGDYIFHVDLSGRSVATQPERFLITWGGTSATSTITKLAASKGLGDSPASSDLPASAVESPVPVLGLAPPL